MNRNVVYIRILLVVVSIVALLAFVNHTPHRTQRDTWLPSSFNPAGAGTMALYQTLQELHWPVERWRDPLSRLSGYGTGNMLLITRASSGTRVSFSEQEADLLDQWVQKGNTLVLLGALTDSEDTRMLLREFGIAAPEPTNSVHSLFDVFKTEDTKPIEIQPNVAAGAAGTMLVPRANPLPFSYPKGSSVLWEDLGRPYVVDVPLGAGHVVCGASAQLLGRTFLGQGDNLTVALQLLAPGGKVPRHLFFEESHHGFSTTYAVAQLFNHLGVRVAGMLALLGVLTFLGSSLVRFGPVIPLEPQTGRSTLEFIDSIADLYQRADLRNDMIGYLFTETHQRILHRLNLPPTASHELIASRLQQVNPRLPKWKKLAQRFDSRDYVNGLPPSGWLAVARDLIEIKSAMA